MVIVNLVIEYKQDIVRYGLLVKNLLHTSNYVQNNQRSQLAFKKKINELIYKTKFNLIFLINEAIIFCYQIFRWNRFLIK